VFTTLNAHAIRMTLETRKIPATVPNVCGRVGPSIAWPTRRQCAGPNARWNFLKDSTGGRVAFGIKKGNNRVEGRKKKPVLAACRRHRITNVRRDHTQVWGEYTPSSVAVGFLRQRPRGTLEELRALIPTHQLTSEEGIRCVELLAVTLLSLLNVTQPPVPIEEILLDLPQIDVSFAAPIDASGAAKWMQDRWVILIAADEPRVRQRFSLCHELAHVIFHPYSPALFPRLWGRTAADRLERACDYFAACLLMPAAWLESDAAVAGAPNIPELAQRFDVSWATIRRRIKELGLDKQ
jgi:IrrE N-terminal-like domain